MSEVITVELDLAKNVFQVHGADGPGRAGLRHKLRRMAVLEFFSLRKQGLSSNDQHAGEAGRGFRASCSQRYF